jgi:phosphatidylserine/phosphatidylglycerophosphate/cardiolipin synthase-like enzyme
MKTLIKEINIINDGEILYPIVPNGTGYKSSETSNLSIIESGTESVLLKKIISAIDKASELVCLQSFLIQDSEIIDALISAIEERNVKVFVLSSAEARLKDKIEDEADFIKAKYIKLIDEKFKNNFIHRTAENYHAKYILIDPKTNNGNGFVCTNNFTENGFTKNPELAIELNKEQVQELFKVFVYHFWEHSTGEQTNSNEFAIVTPVNEFNLPQLETILITSPNSKYNTLNQALISAIESAGKSISISTYKIDCKIELVKALIKKAQQNITVSLFCRPIENQFNEHLKILLDAGIKIYFHPLLHAKSLLIDDIKGFIFTANIVSKGLDEGLEVGIELDKKQVDDLKTIQENWKSNFSIKAVKSAFIKDLKEIQKFKDGVLVSRLLVDNKKEDSRKIVKVSDLLSFFNQEFTIKDMEVKALKVKLIAEIEQLPIKYQISTSKKIEIKEIEEEKGKKNNVVVINNDFASSDVLSLLNYKELKIFHSNS